MALRQNFQQIQQVNLSPSNTKKFPPKIFKYSWLNDISKNTCEELVEIIIKNVGASPSYFSGVNDVVTDLNEIISSFYKNFSIRTEVFGSCYTELALRDSDVDIFINFGENLPEPPEKLVKTLKRILKGNFGRRDPKRCFIRPIAIMSRIPIVRCIHRSKINCDISFLNLLGVHNSYLVKFLLTLDKRIRPLTLILKFLLKREGLVGSKFFTSFALITLIVFFLQQHKNPILPTVSFLQKLAKKKRMIAGFDTSFTTDISSLPEVTNQLSIPELIQGFFEFYSTFEFGFYIISVFTGKSYLKPVFSNINFIPEELPLLKANFYSETYFHVKKIVCVQSPFHHCVNITRNISQNTLEHFQNYCYSSAAIGKKLFEDNITENNQKKYLETLLIKNINIKRNESFENENIDIYVQDNISFDNGNCTEDSLRNEWAHNVFFNLKYLLSTIMKCEVVVQNETAEEKLLQCQLNDFSLVLRKRRNFTKSKVELSKDIPNIRKEEIISNILHDTMVNNKNQVKLKFEIHCSVRKKPTCFCLNLKSQEQEKANKPLIQHVFHFIKKNFPKWINETFNENSLKNRLVY